MSNSAALDFQWFQMMLKVTDDDADLQKRAVFD